MSSNVRPESMARITTPELAKAFIDDKDAGEGKLMRYYESVVE